MISNGTYSTSVSRYFDENLGGGSNEWKVNHVKSDNWCDEFYCSFTCALFRPLARLEQRDVKIAKDQKYNVIGGYRMF